MEEFELTNVNEINYGEYNFKPVFSSPLKCIGGVLNVCSKCISSLPTVYALQKHMEQCSIPYKPIYEESSFKISKISPLKNKQLLCLLAQMFIGSKTVYFDVDCYDIFVLYDKDIIGYFSRYKNGDNSLNCFFVFPCFQKAGWGTVLLDYSVNSLIDDPKSPEKPYTKKAIFCFRKYWKYKVIGGESINEISKRTGLTIDDVIIGLELNNFDLRKWKLNGPIEVKKPRMLSKKIKIKNRK